MLGAIQMGMRTVLLIDDDRIFRRGVQSLLGDKGWRILEADDGEAGLLLAAEHTPELIVCDLLMPRTNGFQVCRTVRGDRSRFGTPKIIVSTSSEYAIDRMNAMDAGADFYLVKPLVGGEFSRLVDDLMADSPARQPAAQNPPLIPKGKARLKFWGVRGSIPSPGPSTVYFGGNTSCLELRADGELIILDAGTGIRGLGLNLAKEFAGQPMQMTLLITHTHWDHIQGFPFFAPAYNPRNSMRVLSFEGARRGLEATLSSQMESPYFPITMKQMPSNIQIEELRNLEFEVGSVKVQSVFTNHPGICMGYRLTTKAGVIAYLPDNELFQRQKSQQGEKDAPEARDFAKGKDESLVNFLKGVDILVLDCQYDAQEYAKFVGWGHSCADDSVALAHQAGVKRFFMFHHDPNHDDGKISQMLARCRQLVAEWGGGMEVEAAREGLEVWLGTAEPE